MSLSNHHVARKLRLQSKNQTVQILNHSAAAQHHTIISDLALHKYVNISVLDAVAALFLVMNRRHEPHQSSFKSRHHFLVFSVDHDVGITSLQHKQ